MKEKTCKHTETTTVPPSGQTVNTITDSYQHTNTQETGTRSLFTPFTISRTRKTVNHHQILIHRDVSVLTDLFVTQEEMTILESADATKHSKHSQPRAFDKRLVKSRCPIKHFYIKLSKTQQRPECSDGANLEEK